GRPLFSSQYWPNQGFSYKSAIGLQFHLESTPASLKELVTTDATFIAGSKFAGNENDILSKHFDPNCRTLLFNILNHLTEQIE
ncbi:MAG: type 1 glutamine amidotransferase, partial [Lentilactobacillus diolivorans]|nr:type 1 glutamine amidotransferase [Lentilactobacillus diolivorans]